jgi:hypothetical protein
MQVAAAKGLLTGCVTVTKRDGSVIDYSSGVDVSHSTYGVKLRLIRTVTTGPSYYAY